MGALTICSKDIPLICSIIYNHLLFILNKTKILNIYESALKIILVDFWFFVKWLNVNDFLLTPAQQDINKSGL